MRRLSIYLPDCKFYQPGNKKEKGDERKWQQMLKQCSTQERNRGTG